MGQAADGPGGGIGAHERASDQFGRGAGACGGKTRCGGGGFGGFDGERTGYWRRGRDRICCRKSGRGGCRLSTADWICWLGNFGGVREQSGGGKPRCELRAEGDV